MRHTFTYKMIGNLDPDILTGLKKYVLHIPYTKAVDFEENVIAVRDIKDYLQEPAILKFFVRHMFKLFKPAGHVGSNIAKMFPMSYVPEHSDYAAKIYGPQQDSIVKFQIPIITNPGCGLMWRFNEDNSKPAEALYLEEGGMYIFDNCRIHCSVNLGTTDRYWLTSRWDTNYLIDKNLLDQVSF